MLQVVPLLLKLIEYFTRVPEQDISAPRFGPTRIHVQDLVVLRRIVFHELKLKLVILFLVFLHLILVKSSNLKISHQDHSWLYRLVEILLGIFV